MVRFGLRVTDNKNYSCTGTLFDSIPAYRAEGLGVTKFGRVTIH